MLAAHRGGGSPPTKKQASDTVAGLRYTTERLARDALAEIQNSMVSGTVVSRSTRTVEQACAEWLAGRRSIRPTIRAGYEHALSPLRHRHGDLPVQKLNKGHLDQLVADLMSGRVRRGRAAPQMAADSINPMVNIVSLFWQVTWLAHPVGRSIAIPRSHRRVSRLCLRQWSLVRMGRWSPPKAWAHARPRCGRVPRRGGTLVPTGERPASNAPA